ncbi:unnamed protein product [Paramecium octaurelia]|uniref:Uncharacterized protein n=1 Tax=Paramecium octaurelia TaxID=43137 RepID=A0A8S1TXD6_PAROT|nr:unnamed protein product [Paramecium octaurelia]
MNGFLEIKGSTLFSRTTQNAIKITIVKIFKRKQNHFQQICLCGQAYFRSERLKKQKEQFLQLLCYDNKEGTYFNLKKLLSLRQVKLDEGNQKTFKKMSKLIIRGIILMSFSYWFYVTKFANLVNFYYFVFALFFEKLNIETTKYYRNQRFILILDNCPIHHIKLIEQLLF